MKELLRKNIEFGLLLVLVTLGKWTPMWILHGLTTLIAYILVYITTIRGNKTIARNFRRAYHQSLSKAELRRMTIRYYEALGDYTVEFTKRSHFSKESMMKHCQFRNLELLDEMFREHRFVICYGGHMVNYEWQTSFPLWRPNYGMCHLYRGAKQSAGLDYVMRERSLFGAINISTKSPLRTLVELNRQMDEGTAPHKGYIFGTLAEMDPGNKASHSCPFMRDYQLEVSTVSERIGRQMDMGFVYAHMRRIKRGYYEIELHEMRPNDRDTNPYAYTDDFVRRLEQNILEQPELWMQWGECRF